MDSVRRSNAKDDGAGLFLGEAEQLHSEPSHSLRREFSVGDGGLTRGARDRGRQHRQ